VPGEVFCLLQPETLQPVKLPASSLGAEIGVTATGATDATIEFLGEGLRPPSPVNVAAEPLAGGDLRLSWTRRSRQGFAWVDEIDAPVGEAREQYRVTVTGSANATEKITPTEALVISADTLSLFGSGPVSIDVRQIGDFAMSRAAELTINLS
jgi:hypothetical protein